MSMASYDYDLIVIGSGAGGAIAAQLTAKAGKSVALIEANELGGDCPNVEVPRYAMLQAAHTFQNAKQATRFGIRSTTLSYNYPSMKTWQQLAAKRAGAGVNDEAFIEAGISVIHGRAHLLDPHTVSVGAARFSAQRFLLATGTELSLPTIAGLDTVGFVTPKDILQLNRAPKNLAILGHSYEALEYAQLFASLGSKVHLITNAPRLLEQETELAGQSLTNAFTKDYGMTLHLNANCEKVSRGGLKKQLIVRRGKRKTAVLVDEILLASRTAPTVDFGLENAGVKFDESGILVDARLQTSAPHIFAAGSCLIADTPTALATYQSRVVAHNILHPRRLQTAQSVPLHCLFTNPEIARVGLSETELTNRKRPFQSLTTQLNLAARANLSDEDTGTITVLFHPKSQLLLGATIVGSHASELIHELALAVQNHLTLQQVAHTPHAFGSWSEAIRIACS